MGNNIIKTALGFGLAAIAAVSCNWLDVDPNMGVDDSVVFGSYRNIKSYMEFITDEDHKVDNIFEGFALYEETAAQKFTLANTMDIADGGRLNTSTTGYKKCNLTWDMVSKRNVIEHPISKSMWDVIRVANRTLEHLDGITDCTENEKNEMYAYCYFYRAFAHFVLCRKYGGVPYLEKSLGAGDDWDLPRLSNWETYQKCAEDFQKAYEYCVKIGRMRCDPAPGKEGHLNISVHDEMYPCAARALALKARALVYAASPLSNQQGQKDWEAAAQAAAQALTTALDCQYSLVGKNEYTDLFFNHGVTEESLWNFQIVDIINGSSFWGMYAYPQNSQGMTSGTCPTQNMVDLYETKWGDPLQTAEDRAKAQALGHFNPQDPYSNLDPRFDLTIVHDGTPNRYGTGNINIYKNAQGQWPKTTVSGVVAEFGIEWGSRDNVANGFSNTGYYLNKYWDGNHGKVSPARAHTDNLVRLAELYLLYAEAVNEAYGPSSKAGSCSMTAIDAVNAVRNRIGMPDVLSEFTKDKDSFRKRIQNERIVELAYEDYHYWCDSRRWMILPDRMRATIEGMYITECPVSAEYPNGRIYERRAIPQSRQATWKDCMYYYPFDRSQAQTMVNFKNNELWN